MDIFGIKKKLITHDGSYHADDVFAAATLSLLLEGEKESFDIIRTREPKIISQGDYVFDVGGVYEEKNDKFDHHQVGGAGKRHNGIEYASFGLVWKKYGEKLAGSKKAAELIDKKLCAPIDAWDNGHDIVDNKSETAPYYIQNVFFSFHPTWKEDESGLDEAFFKCVEIAKTVLKREIIQTRDLLEAEEEVTQAYERAEDKRIIILEKNYPFEYVLINFPEPLYAIYPRKADGGWGVKTIKADPKSFINRKNLPKTWAGLQGEDFVNVSGVADALFCHRSLFLAAARSQEGAIKLAQIAVEF